jgi:hypothetical protein
MMNSKLVDTEGRKNDRRVEEMESEGRREWHYISWGEGGDKGHHIVGSFPDLSRFSFW